MTRKKYLKVKLYLYIIEMLPQSISKVYSYGGEDAKEREVYLTPVAQLALIKYLKTREDDYRRLKYK
nr:MAG TPA: hypothetical protein [Bacteriophage sp.]